MQPTTSLHNSPPDSSFDDIRPLVESLAQEVLGTFMGPRSWVELLLTSLLARGHVLIEGVPGVAKTTLAKSFAAVLGCSFRRIQFTPDLLPADITGTYILDMRTQQFVLRHGPVFAHVVLGDEINRAPAKTQSALLEAMQEYQVTIDGESLQLAQPFMVLATQNPFEQAGTYPLPEAQIDRFLFKLVMGYPQESDEKRMLVTHGQPIVTPRAVLSPGQILALQKQAEKVHISDELMDYALALSRYTRNHKRVLLGASPRATLSLMRAAKAFALVHGRSYVVPDDIGSLAQAVLAHRILMNPEFETSGHDPAAEVVAEAIERTPYKRNPHP